jgi:hypothetical protein
VDIDAKDLNDSARAIKSCCQSLRNAGVPDAAIFHALLAGAIAEAVKMSGVHEGFALIDQALIMTRDLING